MKTDITDVERSGGERSVPTDTVFELLCDRRRRYVMSHLTQRVGAVSIEELAEAIAVREQLEGPKRLERISTGLHHNHLPKLVDAGVVAYDPETERVRRLPAADQLEPYLELALADGDA